MAKVLCEVCVSKDGQKVRLVEREDGQRTVEMASTCDAMGQPHWLPWQFGRDWDTRLRVVRTLLEIHIGICELPQDPAPLKALGELRV